MKKSLICGHPQICTNWRGYDFIVVVESWDEDDGYYTPTDGYLILDDPDEPHLAKLVEAHNDRFFPAIVADLPDQLSEGIAEWLDEERQAHADAAADWYIKHRLEEGI